MCVLYIFLPCESFLVLKTFAGTIYVWKFELIYLIKYLLFLKLPFISSHFLSELLMCVCVCLFCFLALLFMSPFQCLLYSICFLYSLFSLLYSTFLPASLFPLLSKVFSTYFLVIPFFSPPLNSLSRPVAIVVHSPHQTHRNTVCLFLSDLRQLLSVPSALLTPSTLS